jgi:hypothetical protein
MSLVPVEGQCAYCANPFNYNLRPQGGGKLQKYCSTKCSQASWAEGNPEKRKAIITRYDQKVENKEKKALRTRRARLRKYNYSDEQFLAQFNRQKQKCYGCLNPLTLETARIDHNHTTNVVRGLLCDHCNWTLGHAKDNPQTMRRLMAFLDYKPEKHNVYLIGSLKNRRIIDIANKLRENPKLDVMDEWITPGELADDRWQEYEKARGRKWPEALKSRGCQNIFMFDRAYMDHADTIVLCMPGGKSSMCELGYAAGSGKNTIIFLDGNEPDRYEVMPNFAGKLIHTLEDLVKEFQ